MSRDSDRLAVAARLFEEGLLGEAERLRRCGEPMELGCKCCRRVISVPKRCKRKWCPVCAAAAADAIVERAGPIIDKVKSPLMLTLTSSHRVHDDPVALITSYIAAVPRFRALLWFRRRVRGGIGAIEVSVPASHDRDGAPRPFSGWHVHYHALLDCDWLSVLSAAPRRGAGRAEVKAAARRALDEINVQWGLTLARHGSLDRTVATSVHVVRADHTTTREVLKYSVSSESLLDTRLQIAPMILAMAGRHMRAPWGSVRKMMRELNAATDNVAPATVCACGAESWAPAPMQSAPPLDAALAALKPTRAPQLPPPPNPWTQSSSTVIAAAYRAERRALPGYEALHANDVLSRLNSKKNRNK